MARSRSVRVTLRCLFPLFFYVLVGAEGHKAKTSVAGTTPWNPHLLETRATEVIRCSNTEPCSNGDCCNGQSGYCGRRPEFCDASVCTSNCDAKPECGVRADKFDCPLNVCCSYWGNCNTGPDFCDERCQSHCSTPPSTGHKFVNPLTLQAGIITNKRNNISQGDVRDLVIGYYEAWTLADDGCRKMPLSNIPIDSLTHLNIAFAYIKPGSYVIYPMEPADDQIFSDLSNLKTRAPGLEIWVSIGGWTFSDNGTDTQPVWGDLASTPAKRGKFIDEVIKFMRNWGFDGVDLDWEYPGAPDRRGNEWVDTENYVSLLSDMRSRFNAEPESFGLSFTAPTSYWYLRWFDIERMMPSVNWINLMSYDLHGSWDDKDSYLGNYVNSHTNLTEIEAALELLWRNNVQAGQVNLGIGFYGRSFQLEDPACNVPGCKQLGPAKAGPCTGQVGILSYDEINKIVKTFNLNTVHDKAAGVKYLSWANDQWIAYDDPETLQEKVAFANQQGLGGLMIWAVDLDDAEHSALNGLLQPDGLGKFAKRNGVNYQLGNWTRQGSQCRLGACSKSPTCDVGFVKHGHDLECPKQGERRNICCDIQHNPDPAQCAWREGFDVFDFLGLGPGIMCSGATCAEGEILMVENDRFWVDNPKDPKAGDARCLIGGKAKYCCKGTGDKKVPMCEPLKDSCAYKVDAPFFGNPTFPNTDHMCGDGKYFLGYSQGPCEIWNNEFQPICCPNETPKDACYIPGPDGGPNGLDGARCNSVDSCPDKGDITAVETLYFPNGFGCAIPIENNPSLTTRPLCCRADKLDIKTKDLPVPLEYLFPKLGPSTDEQKYNLQVDTGTGDDGDANSNAFGFVIMSGPLKDLISLDKRDGSHWELLDCEKHEERQTVRAVCTDTSVNGNCGDIFLGQVAETVVEMPPHCGAGRYAVAVSLEPSRNQTMPSDVELRLRRRGAVAPRMYDLTFDYDFSPIYQRGKSDVLLRIDYASEPGYWANIVDKPGEHKRSLEEIHETVKRDHDGSWPDYLHYTFRKEKRETPEDRLDELHKRWFSSDLGHWLDELRNVDIEYEAVRHRIFNNYRWELFDESIQCVNYRARMHSWIDLDIDVEVTATISLIGDLADPKTWEQVGALFRTKGGVVTKLFVEADAELFFTTGPIELFGAQNFGLTFAIPGIVTIGPNFRIIGQINGNAALHLDASVKFDVVNWDYTQRYPIKNHGTDVKDATLEDKKADAPLVGAKDSDDDNAGPVFHADVTANGAITVSVIPKVEFGIVFNYEAVPDTVITMALDNRITLYGDAGIGTNQAAFVCYGIEGRSTLYAAVDAPAIFGYSLSNRWDIFDKPFDLIKRTCPIGGG